jgi:hypothetical protein
MISRAISLRAARLFVCLLCFVVTTHPARTATPAVSYDRDIRPILSDKCYRCHGPDAEARQAELRLDTREGIPEHVVVPGKPGESELVARITSDDPDVRMPPPDSHLTLSDGQKQLIQRWIAEGAAFSEHWSFQPLPQSVPVPPVKNERWPRQILDRFVLARLEAEDVQPARRADALRLLRRVTLDLTGLPPSVDECREFEKRAAEDLDVALAEAVDRLLASPAYGEHMAVAWLDAARYADSYGYQSDQLNTQWPYRDWVVRAFNDNLSYNEFLTWQVAGDLLENATREQILATAFNRLHRLTNEGGSIAEEWLVENAADRLHTLGTAVLGLTVECARCHDHKYDPITMRDYYSLMAFFNSIDENGMYDHAAKVPSPSLLLPTEVQGAEISSARLEITKAEGALAKAIEDAAPRFEAWLAKPQAVENADLVAIYSFDGELGEIRNEAPGKSGSGDGAGLQSTLGVRGRAVRFDGDHGAVFPDVFQVDRWDEFTLDFWLRDNAANPLPVVVLQRTFGTDVGYNGFDLMLEGGALEARFYRVWPGNAIGVRSQEKLAHGKWQHVTVTYDGSSTAQGLRLFLNGNELRTSTLRNRMHKRASLPTHGEGHLTLGQRFRDRGFRDGEIDELRIYDRAITPLEIRNLHDGQALDVACRVGRTRRVGRAQRDPPIPDHGGSRGTRPTLQEQLRTYFLSAIDEPARKATRELRAGRRKLVEAEEPMQEVPVMEELAEPRPTYILARGAYDAPKTDANRVERGTFADMLIPFPEDALRNRLGLAHWLTDVRHPLTSRVFVNRLWSNFFGRGLVATPENFGRQGSTPSHPELLDWLARDFITSGWDIKRLCRTIVLSATYQQDSRCDPALRQRDSENVLLARGPSRRLSAEQIRDVALAASGLLEAKLGGPPVSPYQPGGDLWRETNTMSPAYRQSIGRDLYRRSLYSVWKRTTPLPNMLVFDAPTREVCTVARGRTNTPLQALVLLNDVQFVEAARALATTVSHEHADLGERIRAAFLSLTGRHADPDELDLLITIYNEQRKLFGETGQQSASQFISLGDSELDKSLPPDQLAALTVVCQTILNLDATVFER